MTNRQMENRARKIKELEEQIKMLEGQADALKAELKEEMEKQNTEEVQTKTFIIRWQMIVSHKLDTKELKANMPDIYDTFTKETEYKRFTIA